MGERDASDKEKVLPLHSLAKAIQNGPDKQTIEALKRYALHECMRSVKNSGTKISNT